MKVLREFESHRFRQSQSAINRAIIRRIGMRANSRNWLLVIGLLFIVAACVAAYLITAPAEADISLLRDRPDAHYSEYSAFV